VQLEGHRPDKFIVLGYLTPGEESRAAMERAMEGWADSEMRLSDLVGHFQLLPAIDAVSEVVSGNCEKADARDNPGQ
jgi:hypothetical protein